MNWLTQIILQPALEVESKFYQRAPVSPTLPYQKDPHPHHLDTCINAQDTMRTRVRVFIKVHIRDRLLPSPAFISKAFPSPLKKKKKKINNNKIKSYKKCTSATSVIA